MHMNAGLVIKSEQQNTGVSKDTTGSALVKSKDLEAKSPGEKKWAALSPCPLHSATLL